MTSGISVLILAFNEERNLPGALESLVGHCEDVIVLDSFSTDSTTQIAEAWGARVVRRNFDNYASQRRFGLRMDFRSPWVLMLDADERVTAELWHEMLSAISCAGDEITMFRMRRKDIFLGRWLRRSSGYPTWFGRLVRPDKVQIEREINEEYIPLGQARSLKTHLIHFPFNRGVSHWIDRHNIYSSLECRKMREEASVPIPWSSLFFGGSVERRKASKRLAFRLPLRPTLVFIYLYFVRFGFMDGRAGYAYCRLRAAYEMFIDAKRMECDWNERSQT